MSFALRQFPVELLNSVPNAKIPEGKDVNDFVIDHLLSVSSNWRDSFQLMEWLHDSLEAIIPLPAGRCVEGVVAKPVDYNSPFDLILRDIGISEEYAMMLMGVENGKFAPPVSVSDIGNDGLLSTLASTLANPDSFFDHMTLLGIDFDLAKVVENMQVSLKFCTFVLNESGEIGYAVDVNISKADDPTFLKVFKAVFGSMILTNIQGLAKSLALVIATIIEQGENLYPFTRGHTLQSLLSYLDEDDKFYRLVSLAKKTKALYKAKSEGGSHVIN